MRPRDFLFRPRWKLHQTGARDSDTLVPQWQQETIDFCAAESLSMQSRRSPGARRGPSEIPAAAS